MDRAKLGVGLAGLGRHGTRYAQHLLAGSIDPARLVAVHRRDSDRGRAWAEPRGIAFHDNLDDLAHDPRVDVVVGALPPARHTDVVSAAAAAGKPVLVEKPLAPDPESARRALEVAEKAGILAMVAHTLRFNSVIRALRDYRTHVGDLQLIAINQRSEPSGRSWLDDERQGGVIFDTGVHAVDLLRTLGGGEIDEVLGFGRDLLTDRVADLFCVCLRLEPGGLLATLDNSRTTGGRTGRIELVGTEGQLIADHVHGFVQLVRGRHAEALLVEAPVPTVQEALRAFVGAVRGAEPSPIPLSEGLAAVEGAERIRTALRRQRRG